MKMLEKKLQTHGHVHSHTEDDDDEGQGLLYGAKMASVAMPLPVHNQHHEHEHDHHGGIGVGGGHSSCSSGAGSNHLNHHQGSSSSTSLVGRRSKSKESATEEDKGQSYVWKEEEEEPLFRKQSKSSYDRGRDGEQEGDDIPIIPGLMLLHSSSDMDSAFEEEDDDDEEMEEEGSRRRRKRRRSSSDDVNTNSRKEEKESIFKTQTDQDGRQCEQEEQDKLTRAEQPAEKQEDYTFAQVCDNDADYNNYDDEQQGLFDPTTDEMGRQQDQQSPSHFHQEVNLEQVEPPYFDELGNEYEYRLVAPDGGWGWFVLAGSILVNILIPGTVKSFGVLFVEFIEVFNATPSSAAWIPAISYFLYSSTGPFASALAIKYSHRAVTIAGGLLAAIGLMSSYFATSIPYLYVSYGIVGGLGAGLAYPIGVFMVATYFERRRGLANGLCTSGSALGSVLIPPLLRWLLANYGYRGAIAIMGALLLNVCLAAIFYSPVHKHYKKVLVLKQQQFIPDDDPVLLIQQQPPYSPSSPPANQQISSSSNQIPIPIRQMPPPANMAAAASMPITIPLPQTQFDGRTNNSVSNRRAIFHIGNEQDNSLRRATFHIGGGGGAGNEGGESWSLKSGESGASPLPLRVLDFLGSSSPRAGVGARIARSHIEDITETGTPTATPTPTPTAGAASKSRSRLNLTAIPEDDDDSFGGESNAAAAGEQGGLSGAGASFVAGGQGGRTGSWISKQPLQSQSQSRLVFNFSQGSNLYQQPSGTTGVGGLSRTLSMASNVSSSSFRYMSTIHHGSTLTAMEYDKTVPDIATALTVTSIKKSCWNCLNWKPPCCRPLADPDQVDRDTEAAAQDTQGLAQVPTDKIEIPQPPAPSTKFIDFSLLNDRLFIVMIISSATTAIGYTNFIILLPSYALHKGYNKSEASLQLSIVALLDFIGRIGGAALSDYLLRCRVNRKWFFIVGLFFSGLALCTLSLSVGDQLTPCCAAFGLSSGIYIGLQAVILADRLGPEKLGSSYGITLFVNGCVQLLGPPLCGNLLEQTDNDYEMIFFGLGVILLAGSSIWLLLPCIDNHPPITTAIVQQQPITITKQEQVKV